MTYLPAAVQSEMSELCQKSTLAELSAVECIEIGIPT